MVRVSESDAGSWTWGTSSRAWIELVILVVVLAAFFYFKRWWVNR